MRFGNAFATRICVGVLVALVLFVEWQLHEKMQSVSLTQTEPNAPLKPQPNLAVKQEIHDGDLGDGDLGENPQCVSQTLRPWSVEDVREVRVLQMDALPEARIMISQLQTEVEKLRSEVARLKTIEEISGLVDKQIKAAEAIQLTSDLEFLPMMLGPREKPVNRKKSLIVMGIGKGSEAVVDDLVKRFGMNNFQYVFFLYDNDFSIWSGYRWFEKSIRIAVTRQMKWWYFKRFLHPDVVEVYEYIFLADSDADYSQIHPKTIMSTLREFNIQVAQPSHCNQSHSDWTHPGQAPSFHRETMKNIEESPLRALFHRTLPTEQQDPGYNVEQEKKLLQETLKSESLRDVDAKVGRWTDFVECGPLTIFSREAWNCFWKYIQNDGATGWGYDFYFETLCAPRQAALLDNQCLYHLHTHSASSNKVYKRRKKNEWQTVMRRLGNTHKARMMFYGPITLSNSTVWKKIHNE